MNFAGDVCGDENTAASHEWLVANGIGGFASGTISGELTRRYHGLLVAALQPPLGRALLVAKFDEVGQYGGRSFSLSTNRWADGSLSRQGYRNIERFCLEGATPMWVFACGEARLEKRVWMQPGANTTYVQYRLLQGNAPFDLSARVLVNTRDYHGATRGGWRMGSQAVPHGLRFTAPGKSAPFYLLSLQAHLIPQHEWVSGFALREEQRRGYAGLEDHLCAAEFHARLQAGETLTLVVSTEPEPNLDGPSAYAERQLHERQLVAAFQHAHPGHSISPPLQQLLLAADQFVVQRCVAGEASGRSIIAGYPWFGDWGRDTMISLPGLTLATGRPEIAHQILLTYAHYVYQGMLPNRFPDEGQAPEYNTVDATLWYFEALRAYLAATGDDDLLRRLFPVLKGIVAWHQRGTRYRIHTDPQDGLLYAGVPGAQLTWMDAKVGEWVVTPRTGKPVEINALWYHALMCMADFARRLDEPAETYESWARQVQASFDRFWYAAGSYCYDVIDGPQGDDASLRPNQLLAVSLSNSPLSPEQQKQVVDVCARRLLTPHGLRSLAPAHPDYAGVYSGDVRQRDGAYHQGTVWGWLIGPFISAHLRVYGDPQQAQTFLQPLLRQLEDYGLGSIGEIFDGDPPFTPRGCIAQAWSVAEVLRAYQQISSG